ncbi:hypothetical protein VTN00DRAFT_7348 [Thermoascus crustaceus]|uniref:uncharacterized protein n=1 Tax=Thermoascus crustaceus TaxID=5088 RepID=UPI00374474DE
MAQIPTPPPSRHVSEAPEASPKPAGPSSDLLQSLDVLLERYLQLLDHYEKLQAKLGKQLSLGFFSLAQANYFSSPGRRYGEDYYDERMKATRKISLQKLSRSASFDGTPGTDLESRKSNRPCSYGYSFKIEPGSSDHATEEVKDGNGTTEPPMTSPQTQPLDSGTGHQIVDGIKPSSASQEPAMMEPISSSEPASPKKTFRPSDPISWYGVLVPPSLRSAQKSFTVAVEECVPELASIMTEMREVEGKVNELRSKIGLT